MSKEEYRPQPSKQPEQRKPQLEGGNGALGLPQTVHESAKPPPEAVVNEPRLTAEERREQHRKYMKDYRKRNRDKVNAYQRRYRSDDPITRPNEKLREHQMRLAEERIAKFREQQANDPSTELEQREQPQSEAIQIFPSPSED